VFIVAGSPVVGQAKALIGADGVGGEVTTGTVGTRGAGFPAIPAKADTLRVGTAAAELTPRLPISVDPIGMPVRATPPGAIGDVDVGVDDAAVMFDPEPHIPDNPDVSSVPELVDIPDVTGVPGIAKVVGVVPPPSKVAVDPNIPDGEVPTVEHAVPLATEEKGSGLTPAEVISVDPIGIPVAATGAPGPPPSGEVRPRAGVSAIMPT
jgi:hypothetical protein